MTPKNTNYKRSAKLSPVFDSAEVGKLVKEFVKEQGGTAGVDVNDLLRKLAKTTLETLLEAEMTEHVGYERHDIEGRGSGNSRNGKGSKMVRGDFGEVEISTPRDRNGSFDPIIVGKRERTLGSFQEKIISLYTRGLTTREIEGHLKEIYDIEVSPQFISRATDAISEDVTQWQNRPLEKFYPVVFVDGLRVPVRTTKNSVAKKCVYTVLGIAPSGKQEVLGLWVEETEGAKFWLSVLNDIKARGVEDILILCGDGLKGLPEAVEAAFAQTDVQLCVVHQIRNATRFVSYKDRREFCADMREIYTAPTIAAAEQALEALAQKWKNKYPMSVDSWSRNWDKLTTFFRYPLELRKIIYTTNAIESLHARMRKNTRNRKVFPSDESLLKLLYLNIKNFTAKWAKKQNWNTVYNQLAIMFPERFDLNEDIVLN